MSAQTNENAIFDRDLMLVFRRRAFQRAEPGADFLLRRVADDLEERLGAVERRFPVAVDLAGHTGAAAAAIAQTGKADYVLRIERDTEFLQGPFPAIVGDEEALPLKPGSADLIVSLMALHATNDTPGAMVQIARALKPDGLFLAALSGSGTLGELRESLLQAEIELTGGASPRVMPFADVRDVGSLLQRAGFALPVTDVENITVRYDSLFNLMADLRAMGMQNILHGRSRKPVSKRLFLRAAEIYAERFSDPDGRIRATFSIIWLSGWAPHESQQKPLKPGSAKASLAEALKKAEDG
ncbi:methyltransferase domain-containing protein [Brucella suis]|uniref:Biotin synthesis protein bioC n=1 Tax=Brucella suis (strain ATCC 23445 / NCTC 10510) TaxID=470137 RepID=B0CID3_BRUSI|nr:methyltransferase domain-containing protein [Brucella suis]ABY38739.1 Biotin synthesis protein bioC [Brucella suis ATCC 23445]AIB18386.1 SAM-dependent methyltransferase, BioC-like [Brucella suis bv. 2]AIB21773.1 SAM-dependent methyltransferase, BioC-like [Brucella suis bv. 2]AIB25126.1 SAM-dependent methyltransferase, BioC-like [Brucella suis bv. 2]AIB28519.1 SAM-dependent methyltransferase, BioC-like [Brucella suis bv. 2]